MDEGGLKAAVAGQIRVGAHGWQGLHDAALDIDAVRRSVMLNGRIIEDYPNDVRGPSALVLSFLPDDNPVHSVWAWHHPSDVPFLITSYRPDARRWSADYRIRLP
jgi:hypothetical protein